MGFVEYLAEQELADESAKERMGGVRFFFAEFYASLDRLLRLLAAAYTDKGEVTGCAVSRVQGILCSRVADDLRALWLVAERGLVAQALAISSSAMEAAMASVLIGGDANAALRWIGWTDTEWAPYRAYELYAALHRLDGAGKSAGVNGDKVLYKWFCLGKHVNPIVQLQVAVATSTQGYVLRTDRQIPGGSQLGVIKALDFGMTTVMRAVFETVKQTRMPGDDPDAIWESAQAVVAAQREIFTALAPLYGDPNHEADDATS